MAPPDPVEQIEVVGKEVTPAIYEATPVETEVITAERIELVPARDVSDALRNVVGLRMQQRVQGQAAAASIEGMPAEYTKLLVNRQHYAGEIGGVEDLEDVPITNVDEIRVIRGPQAVRYGSDAGGAVIDVRTLRAPPTDGIDLHVDGGGGSDSALYGAQSTAASYGPFGISLATTYNRIDSPEPRGSDAVITSPGEDGTERWQDLYGTVSYQGSERFRAYTNLGWRDESDRFSLDQPDDPGLLPNDPNDDVPQPDVPGRMDAARWLGSGGFTAELTDTLSLESEVFRFSSGIDSNIGRSFTLDEDEWKLDTALVAEPRLFDFASRLTLGIDWRVPRLQSREQPFIAEDVDDPVEIAGASVDESFSTTGIYAIAEADLTSWATLQLGGREQLHSHFQSKFVPQVALLLEPLDTLRLRFSWGESYRIPSLRDLYQPPVAQINGAYFLAGNPELRTESASGFRAGFELLPADWMSLSATYFENEIDDYIRSAPAGSVVIGFTPGVPPGDFYCSRPVNQSKPECQPGYVPPPIASEKTLYRKTNLDKVVTRGLELQLEMHPHANVDLRVGYGYLRTFVDSKTLIDLKELPNEPRHTVDLQGTFWLPRLDTSIAVRGRWRDDALTESTGTGLATFATLGRSDPSWLVDVRVVQPLFSGLQAYVDVENLTNEDAIDSYEIRHRTVFVGLRYDFESRAGGSE